jgi:carboxypeptidase D
MVRGYMSNTELETAVHAFGSRCSNISRVYRYTMYNVLLL